MSGGLEMHHLLAEMIRDHRPLSQFASGFTLSGVMFDLARLIGCILLCSPDARIRISLPSRPDTVHRPGPSKSDTTRCR